MNGANTAAPARACAIALVDDITGYPVIDGNTVYAGNHSGRVVALNLNSGERLWTAQHGQVPNALQGNADQNTPIYVDGTVYHCAYNNVVTALDGATGEIKWQFNPQASAPIWMRCSQRWPQGSQSKQQVTRRVS